MLATRVHPRKSPALGIMREEAHDMHTVPPPIRRLLPLVGTGADGCRAVRMPDPAGRICARRGTIRVSK
jgi:hypothetical protein